MSMELHHDDLTPVLDPEAAKKAMQTYQEICKAMLEKSDYQTIGDKQYKKRSAWRKLARAFGISDEIVEEKREVLPSGEIIYTIKVRAFVGNRSCIGVAKCSSSEKGKLQSGHMEHDLFSTCHTRSKNRAIADLIGCGEVSADEMTGPQAHPQQETILMQKTDEHKPSAGWLPKTDAEKAAYEKARSLGKQLGPQK